jgi:hypothetical protein
MVKRVLSAPFNVSPLQTPESFKGLTSSVEGRVGDEYAPDRSEDNS